MCRLLIQDQLVWVGKVHSSLPWGRGQMGGLTSRWGAVAMADEGAQRGRPGRPLGVPNRDKAELRALLQERVHEFTELRRRQDEQDGLPPEQQQQIVDDYDPVVAMAIVAVDRRTKLQDSIRCNSEVAQYVRPKLKSVEVTTDPEALETLEERRQLSERLVGLLEAAASAKKAKAPRAWPKGHEPPPETPDE